MVLYCCVIGCGNNSKKARKDPNSDVSFHSFPANPDLKHKWLRAIGRPNWSPLNYSRVCSAHFNYEQINHEGYRKRIQEEAVPVNLLPPNANFEASDVEACRICLATDVKIYPLRDTYLGTCMDSIAGAFGQNGMNFEDMPQYVCYQCVPDLIKSKKLIEKCMISQATLLDIYVMNRQITKKLIKEHNAMIPSENKSLKEFILKHNDENNTLQDTATDPNDDGNFYIKNEIKNEYADTHLQKKSNAETLQEEFDENYDDVDEDDEHDDDDDVEKIVLYPDDIMQDDELDKNLSARKEKITKSIISEPKKSQPSLKTPLESYMVKYHDEDDEEQYDDDDDNEADDNEIDDYDDHDYDINASSLSIDSNDNDEDYLRNDDVTNTLSDTHLEIDDGDRDELEIEFDEENDDDDDDDVKEIVIYTSPDDVDENGDETFKEKENVCKEKKVYIRKNHRLPPDETNLLKYYNIVDLSLKEQIQEWKKRTAAHSLTSETLYQCEICNKTFANVRSYRVHLSNHEPSFGRAQCPICKLRFKTPAQATLHSKRVHSRMYFCKSCPKSYNNVDVARKHQRWHMEHSLTHACSLCGLAYSTQNELDSHRLTAHLRSVKEKVITKKYSCETCEIDFASESARQVHLLTSNKHRKKPKLWGRQTETALQDANLSKSCIICDIKCPSYKELALHMKAEHSRPHNKNRLWRDNMVYPRDCELCGVTMTTRKKHWLHVRWKHPKSVDSYKAVIKTICDICGKGCQSLTKLHYHQLRHRSPTVRCDRCPRVFYDKFGLARHAATHDNDKPHQCSTCGRAFKLLNNLKRHYRVHTDIAPYECSICGNKFKYSTSVNLHVRTVHYKLPQPLRKKRSKPNKNTTDSFNDNKM